MNPLEIDVTQRWQRILDGDTQAFAALVDEFKNLVTSIADSSMGDLSSSEEIAQETFLVVWRSRQELCDRGKLVSWISAIGVSAVLAVLLPIVMYRRVEVTIRYRSWLVLVTKLAAL